MNDRLAYTRKEAAELCGVSVDTIAKAKNSGRLKGKRLNTDDTRSKELYTREALMAWIESLGDA